MNKRNIMIDVMKMSIDKLLLEMNSDDIKSITKSEWNNRSEDDKGMDKG